jgi:hypothetical protein
MPKKKRYLKSVNVNFISLVDKGANQKTIIFKSADPTKNTYQKIIRLKKVDEDQRLVYGIVYSPDEVDTDGDFTTADVIKDAAYTFMKNRNTLNVDKQHDFDPNEGFVAESWLTKKKDPVFPDDPEGSWAVAIKVTKDDTWFKVKSGEITGLSMSGLAVVEEVKEEDSETSFIGKITKAIKEGFSSIKKDFNSNFNNDIVRRMGWALTDSISEVLNDDSITDKKAAIITNIDQFKEALDKIEFQKSNKSTNNKNEEIDMTKDEVTKLITKSIEDLQKSFDDFKSKIEKNSGDWEKRLDVVEKSTAGSSQSKTTEDLNKSNGEYKGPSWLS